MGTFGGHALPGSFFIVFSVWWAIQMLNRYYTCRKCNILYRSSVSFRCPFLCGRFKDWPVEALVKLLFISVGITGEVYCGIRNGQLRALGNAQHVTMYVCFGLAAVVEMLLHYKVPLPKDIDYAFLWLAFFIEGLLFNFHLHGRDILDVHLHRLLICTIAANVFAIMAEMMWRNNVLISLTRCYFLLLQGTWFWQVGFVLFNPLPGAEHWNSHDNDSLMVATLLYTWHCVAVSLFMLSIGAIVSCFHREKRKRSFNEDVIAMKSLINPTGHGHDCDCDIEF